MRLRLLNGDASLLLTVDGVTLLVDPWLIGSEVDYAPWFNEAWHTDPVVPLEDVGDHDAVLITQHYPDHCHLETLRGLPERPLLAVDQAMSKLAPLARPRHALPAWGSPPLRFRGLRLWRLSRPWYRPPAYHGIVVAGADDAVLLAPHGLPAAVGAEVAREVSVRLVATSRMHFQLPFFLGGAVNPGPEAAQALLAAVGARGVVIHDEDKRSEGWVSRLARVRRPPPDASWLSPEIGEWLEL